MYFDEKHVIRMKLYVYYKYDKIGILICRIKRCEYMIVNKNIELLNKGLNAYSLRHEVITNNIANGDTPGYKRQDVEFDKVLKNAINNNETLEAYTTNEKHIKINNTEINTINPKVVTTKNTKARLDGNNVDIDVENAELAKNHIKYSVVSQQITNYFRRMKNAISEGRR